MGKKSYITRYYSYYAQYDFQGVFQTYTSLYCFDMKTI